MLKVRGILFSIFLTLLPMQAFADASSASAPAASPEPDATKEERVEVVGSHIKRVDTEGVAPVETVTRKDLEQKGYDNVGDVVRDLGVNSFGSGTVSGNSTTPGSADISLRGLGSDNTLVLLNGQRLPQDAITGTVDINLIPMAAVDRIEILKDGASAIYGSDALGGVVNIVTRKDFQGTQISATGTQPTNYGDGKRADISLVNGLNGEKYNVVTSVNYRYDEQIYSRNRDWSQNGLSQAGNPASYANVDGSGNIGSFNASPNCPTNLLVTTPNGTFCQFQYSNYSEEAPKITQIGVLSEGHYEVNSDLRLTGRINIEHRKAETIAAPAPVSDPNQISIPAADVPQFNLPGVTPGQDLVILGRPTQLGPRVTDVTTNSYGGVFGATKQLPNDWQLDVTSTYTRVTNNLVDSSGFALASVLQQLIDSGAYNPFAAPGSQGDISSAAYVPTEVSSTKLVGLEAKAAGNIATLPSGDVGLAIGAIVNYANYSDVTDAQTLNNNVLGNAGSSGAGQRTSEAFYSEFAIPLIAKKLDAQVAGRFDHYSDFGSTVNPKLGLLYHAAPSLLFRGSVGTGFRAPLLNELYAGQSSGNPSFIDAVTCARYGGQACQAAQYNVTSSGNPNLKQETSVSYTLGGIFEPTKDFNIGTDWFYTKINNMPGIDYNDLTLAEKNGVDTSQYGVTVNRDSNGYITNIVAPLQNLSSEQELGVDITSSYSWWKWKLATEQNQLFFYKTTGFPGIPLTNKLGWNGMPKWRNTTSLSYMFSDKMDISLAMRTIPKQKTLDQTSYISRLTTFDLSYALKTKKYGDFTVSVINIANTAPPLDYSNPQSMVNYSLYDPNGRQFVLGYKKDL